MIVLAIYALIIAHPGPIFRNSGANNYESHVTATSNDFTEKAETGMSGLQHGV